MSRPIVPVLVLLAATGWAVACGDGTTDPPPPEPPRAATLTVTPATAELTALGSTERFSARVLDQHGQAMAAAAVAWSSGDASVATVDAAGLATAAGNGTATITATSGSASGSAAVTVEQAVSAVAVSPAADTLVARGDTVRLTAAASDANGHAVAGAEFVWASGDTTVATVDASGLATGVGAGEAEVTATASGIAGGAALTVVNAAPMAIAVMPDAVALTALGQTARIAAEVRDQIGRVMEGVPVSWSSSDTTVAAVDSAGLVRAVGSGSTEVTASAGDARGGALVTVTQSAGSVVVSPAADTVAPGDTVRLMAEAFDANGHPVEGAEFAWSSMNAAVATVDASGLATGVAEGTATIAATAGSASGTSEITVVNPDRAALVALYQATDGSNWTNNENWLTDAPLGEWYGVETDGAGRVSSLRLPQKNLIGPIPPDLGRLANLHELYLQENELQGPIPPELGNLNNLEFLILPRNNLTGPIPPELGRLPLHFLHLANNSLTGPIPPELGNLTGLNSLFLYDNRLTGPIPASLARLPLEWFWFQANDGLCAPGTAPFAAWLEGIDNRRGAFCNESDQDVLKALFEAAGGTDWTDSGGWLATPTLEEWYGVTADSLGRVVTLVLTRNGLAGHLPPHLGTLDEMTRLRIGGNALSGPLPLSLTGLALVELDYADTDLCVPAEAEFQAWLNAVPSHTGTGVECAPLTNREILVALYQATGGTEWGDAENWLTDAPLGDWYGVSVDAQGRVTALHLAKNNLSGPIPPGLANLTHLTQLQLSANALTGPVPSELGGLVNLRILYLDGNDLTGPIPSELGGLVNLRSLTLSWNDLSGPIPSELGSLASLHALYLSGNNLTGSIPSELGSLVNLESLYLAENDLSGPIPSELGSLVNLGSLYLAENDLSGPIPSELGSLVNLGSLYLGENELSGPLPPALGKLANLTELRLNGNVLSGSVPPAFGGLTGLRELVLSANIGMSGRLPNSLTNLQSLETLQAGQTGLCAPSEASFLEWLEGVLDRWVALCEGGAAYLTQAVQSRQFPVPLVAGEQALLRVFVTAARANNERIPPVRASFYLGGALAHAVEIAGKPGPISTEIEEGSLARSANAEIPGKVVQPGLEMVVEIDPEGTLDRGLGVAKRIPETGRTTVAVHAMPFLDLTLIPFLWQQAQDSTILDSVREMATDPQNHELLWATRTLLPVGGLEVRAHEPVLSSSNFSEDLLVQTAMIRVMEGGTGHYMGTISQYSGSTGVGELGGRVSFAAPRATTMAHELGHNFSLLHAPCGGASGPDPLFPYSDGSTGAWGYDFAARGTLVSPDTPDLMSYCNPDWISDYHFDKALRFRLADEGATAAATATAPTPSLLLWGRTDAEGRPHLEPVFVVDAPALLPVSAGEYRLTGRSAADRDLFTLDFAMPETTDGDGRSSFVFALPAPPEWADDLASVTLSGPGGSITLDGDSDIPMTILRDPRTGRIRGFLREGPLATQAAADAAGGPAGPGLETIFSRGIPDAAWRR